MFWELDHHSRDADWVTLANGMLSIKKAGTYFVYAQVGGHVHTELNDIHTYIYTYRQTNRQTDRYTYIQTDRQTDIHKWSIGCI